MKPEFPEKKTKNKKTESGEDQAGSP